ncbi:hypothetical protein ACSFA3_04055 [Variovorax sp. RHLX14]|uniref:hypothetical protein n=1 Tax=Variovorax sp. RHLX14 TaxID=1259731 RepID=UPI003F48D56C
MITSIKAPLSTLQILERRADETSKSVDETLSNFDIASQADWDALSDNRMDSQIAVWARNDFHRLQHQTAKSILAST